MTTKTQLLVRLPVELKSQLRKRAVANNRTANGEVIAILTQVIAAEKDPRG